MANIFKAKTLVGKSGIFSQEVIAPNLVYNTGNQTINGNKTFVNNLEVQGTGILNALDLSNISEFDFSGTNISLINGNVNISGGTLYISGNPVLTILPNTIVYTTGDQYISGSKIFGKNNKIISGNQNLILGGENNCISGNYSIIGGGFNHQIRSDYGVILGGVGAQVTNSYGNIIGSLGGYANGNKSIVIGGNYSNANGNESIIIGGYLNNTNAFGSFVFGGTYNCIRSTSSYSNIIGGTTNEITGSSSMYSNIIGGGSNKITDSNRSAIIAGNSNKLINADCSSIVGGAENKISGSLSFVGGGYYNYNCSQMSFIGAGYNNCNFGGTSFIGGGYGNEIKYGSDTSSIMGGFRNKISGVYSIIGGGAFNEVLASNSYIVGGCCSIIAPDHNGSAILGDGQNRQHNSSGAYTLTIDFASGVYFAKPNIFGKVSFNSPIDLNNIDILSLSGVDISITSGNIVLTNRPTVNGIPVLLSGEAASLPTAIVYTTGNQTIAGTKTFSANTYFQNDIIVTGNIRGSGTAYFSDNLNIANNLNVSGNINNPTLVLTKGKQTISGVKTFADTMSLNAYTENGYNSSNLDYRLNIGGNTDENVGIQIDAYGTNPAQILMRRARGIPTGLSGVLKDDVLFNLQARGYVSGLNDYSSNSRAAIRLIADENWIAKTGYTGQGTYILFRTTNVGSGLAMDKVTIGTSGINLLDGNIYFNNGGYINLSNAGGSIDASNYGGNIYTYGYPDGSKIGGSIYTYADAEGNGGDINTSDGGGYISTNANGGYIDTSLFGGIIDTSDGGGSIFMNNPGAGSLDTRPGGASEPGGSINTYGGDNAVGGNINTSAASDGGHGGNIYTYGAQGAAGGNIYTYAGLNISGGSINLSQNSGANFSIQTANLPATQNDGSIYNKVNDNLYIRKNNAWEKVITDRFNPVYTTGNQTISGTKNFTTRPTVNGSGVLLNGEVINKSNYFILNFGHTSDQPTASSHNYFAPHNLGYNASGPNRRYIQILETGIARKASWQHIAGTTLISPTLNCTGYFINTSTIPPQTGVISTGILSNNTNIPNNFTGMITPPVTINAGDYVVCSLFTPAFTPSFSGVRDTVNIYCYY
jgi:hypothetical protein